MSLETRLKRAEQAIAKLPAFAPKKALEPVDVEAWRLAAEVYRAVIHQEPCSMTPRQQINALKALPWLGPSWEEDGRHQTVLTAAGIECNVERIETLRCWVDMTLDKILWASLGDHMEAGLPLSDDDREWVRWRTRLIFRYEKNTVEEIIHSHARGPWTGKFEVSARRDLEKLEERYERWRTGLPCDHRHGYLQPEEFMYVPLIAAYLEQLQAEEEALS